MNPTVLLVEDNAQLARGIVDRLRSAGVHVLHSPNGVGAVQMAAEAQPDAVVLDINLPDIDGFEVCRQIRKNLALRQPRIIFLSAHTQATFRRSAREAGGDAFLPKTCGGTEVLKEILMLNRRNASTQPGSTAGRPATRDGAAASKTTTTLAAEESLS